MDESDIQESKEIRERLKRLTHIALDIQKEAESHYKDLESNQSGLDKSMVYVNKSLAKIRNLAKRKFNHTFYLIIATVFLVMLFYILFF
ncbi:hypothetical protein CWI37_0057p0060 [Hamiltosporidium tvaerminnensis]|uniref:t-SNARE coiled-coil homology domain-containing protein n=1 Tax=Hamiltosporidium tvaerminnensis TaxID=1176355 RepID=A0A4Q9LCE1_9MICR|nr:hypothetical protein CWI37_0057p0060 [Hamiltosporidium tvaerminnensis]